MINFNLYSDFDLNDLFDFDSNEVITLICEEVSKVLKITDDHVLSFIVINNEQIHKINKDYRKIDRPTDVISFAEIDNYKLNNDPTVPYELGDIYLSYEKVYEQALSYGHSRKREFSFLVTHGILHLLGYDHMKKEDEIVMFGLQDQILNNLKITR